MRLATMHMGIILLILGCSTLSAQTQIEPHWSPYDYPKELPAGAKVHIIAEGESLWRIARSQLGDPYLWPQLFAKNDYIKDPELIYPGDPLVLDLGVVVTDQTINQSIEEDGGAPSSQPSSPTSGEFAEMEAAADGSTNAEPGTGTDQGQAAQEADAPFAEADGQSQEELSNVSEVSEFDSEANEFVILPAAERSDIDCSTYIHELAKPNDEVPAAIRIVGGENATIASFSADQVVYLNKGALDGVKAGTEYSVRRLLNKVHEGKIFLGQAVDQVGRAQIVTVQDHSATALLTNACFEVLLGDFLVPYEQEPIPLITEIPPADKFARFDSTNSGSIVKVEDDLVSVGKGHMVNISIGTDRNVAPGDVFLFFRPNPSNSKRATYPDLYLGHGVALKSGPQTSMVKIIASITEINLGDRVIPVSQVTQSE